MEVLVRGVGSGEGTIGGRKKGVERALEGWTITQGIACELRDLASLRTLFESKPTLTEARRLINPFVVGSLIGVTKQVNTAADPTQNLSFNLTLTPEQQQSRTQVPLPYAHVGQSLFTIISFVLSFNSPCRGSFCGRPTSRCYLV